MTKFILFSLSISLLFFSCNLINPEEDEYENLDRYNAKIYKLHSELGKKYGIKDYAFDVETIYEKMDLSNLVSHMLELGEYKFSLIEEKHDTISNQYISIFESGGKNYEFRTSSLSDYVDLETIMPSLDSITQDQKPTFEYNFSNIDGGQVATLIFANSENLANAVDEGYPCSLESGIWEFENEWKWGVYSDIKMNEIPDYDELKEKYHQTLQGLRDLGIHAPNLTIHRIHIEDLFKDRSVDIFIDGRQFSNSHNIIGDGGIRCFWDEWGVLLAYTLIEHYDGKPQLFDKTEEKTTVLTADKYKEMVKKAFGK